MSIIIKTPFSFDKLATDPLSYGLRESIIKDCIRELYNDKSILITGARGIGKSSLSYQLQNVLSGEDILLKRCSIRIDIPSYIIVDYICTNYDTLESIVMSIVKKLDEQAETFKTKYKVNKMELEFSFFSFFKTKMELENEQQEKQTSLINSFVDVVEKICEIYVEPHINIAIDELDQLDKMHNISHFVKVVSEILNRKGLQVLSFIFSGQPIILKNLLEQQPAFHRLVKHVELMPLSNDDSQYVVFACLDKAEINTEISDEAQKLLLNIAGGYPYSLHKLGHEAFNAMINRYPENSCFLKIEVDDVIIGLKNMLMDFTSRFDQILYSLDEGESEALNMLIDEWEKNSPYSNSQLVKKLPATFTQKDISEKIKVSSEVINSLCEKQILIPIKKNASIKYRNQDIIYKFSEESFRIFLSWNKHNIESINQYTYE